MDGVEKLRKALEKKTVGFSNGKAEGGGGCQQFYRCFDLPVGAFQKWLGHLRAAWKTRINCTTPPRTR